MYLMLQQEQPDDYAIATGESRKLEDCGGSLCCVGLDWRSMLLSMPACYDQPILLLVENPAKARGTVGMASAT